MQQLTLQFDGYAPMGHPINVSATKQRIGKRILSKAARIAAAIPLSRIGEAIFAAASVLASFALMFLAAIIGG